MYFQCLLGLSKEQNLILKSNLFVKFSSQSIVGRANFFLFIMINGFTFWQMCISMISESLIVEIGDNKTSKVVMYF